LEFGDAEFCAGRKTGEPGEKPSEQGKNQQQIKLNTHIALGWNQIQTTLM